ncbi:hypothetical protein [Microvirga sp. P5_D2]
MEDDIDLLDHAIKSRAGDNMARALRWIGLIGGLALLGIAGVILLD